LSGGLYKVTKNIVINQTIYNTPEEEEEGRGKEREDIKKSKTH